MRQLFRRVFGPRPRVGRWVKVKRLERAFGDVAWYVSELADGRVFVTPGPGSFNGLWVECRDVDVV